VIRAADGDGDDEPEMRLWRSGPIGMSSGEGPAQRGWEVGKGTRRIAG